MRRGYRALIVALVAIGTNFGLHAAFGCWGPGYWRNHGHCGPGDFKNGYYNHHNGCNGNYNGCADPWNCAPKNNSVDGVKDTLPK